MNKPIKPKMLAQLSKIRIAEYGPPYVLTDEQRMAKMIIRKRYRKEFARLAKEKENETEA